MDDKKLVQKRDSYQTTKAFIPLYTLQTYEQAFEIEYTHNISTIPLIILSNLLLTIQSKAGGFVNMLVLDMDAYAEKYGDRAVRKNLTIPAWLNTFAENNHINFSQVLQDSLTKMYQQQQS